MKRKHLPLAKSPHQCPTQREEKKKKRDFLLQGEIGDVDLKEKDAQQFPKIPNDLLVQPPNNAQLISFHSFILLLVIVSSSSSFSSSCLVCLLSSFLDLFFGLGQMG